QEDATEALPQLPEYPPLETFSAISERPLFSQIRRPRAKEEVVDTSSAAELQETWHLVGVILQAQEPIALFAEITGAKRMNLAVGMSLDKKWVLHEVGGDYAVLVGDEDEEARFELWKPRARKVAAPPKGRAVQQQNTQSTPTQPVPNKPSEKTRQGRETRSDPVRTK
ncbi:hypothetical protein, partial [Pontibacterium sp.]|uniref:hypothetical protein n=1 Tax=Pontibacterium sp. TaxID=2036026 RepID=UPI00356141E2